MKARLFAVAVVLGLGVAAAGTALAQDAPVIQSKSRADEVTRQRAAMRLQSLSSRLELTEEQKTRLRPILEAEAGDLRAVRMDTSISPEEQLLRYETVRNTYRERMNGVLTPDQQKQLDALRSQSRERVRETQGQKRKGRVPVEEDQD